MTKETSSPKPTVFSDGSTFDYENGYRSNGAPMATRDRAEAPKIVKTGALLTASVWRGIFNAVLITLVFALLAGLAFLAIGSSVAASQGRENRQAVVEGINDSGAASVVNNKLQREGDKVIAIIENEHGTFKCDVNVVGAGDTTTPTAYVFCAPGTEVPVSATFSIPVPHDPENIFYEAPKEDAEH